MDVGESGVRSREFGVGFWQRVFVNNSVVGIIGYVFEVAGWE